MNTQVIFSSSGKLSHWQYVGHNNHKFGVWPSLLISCRKQIILLAYGLCLHLLLLALLLDSIVMKIFQLS